MKFGVLFFGEVFVFCVFIDDSMMNGDVFMNVW